MSPADETATLPTPCLPTTTPVDGADGPRLPAPPPTPHVVTDATTPVPNPPQLSSPAATTTATPSTSTLILDGALPRLAATVTERSAPEVAAMPTIAAAEVEPDVRSAPTSEPETTPVPVHPMAHLMPERTPPSEASLKAAQLRAAKKAKARKIKVVVAIGAVVVAAVLGPPLFRWVNDAIDQAGSTTTDEPAG